MANADFFKPGRASAQEKAKLTNAAFRQIQDAEAAARQKKTEKLKALRLAAPAPVVEEPARKKRKSS